MAVNPHFLSQMLATPTLNLQDGTDYPHSGLFDMLHKGLKGDYAIKGHADDFDIAQSASSSHTRLTIKGGSVMRNNQIVTIGGGGGSTGATIDCTSSCSDLDFTVNGTTLSGSAQNAEPSTSGDVYLMVVVNAANAIKLRGRQADVNKVPMLLTNDIPIAMIKLVANSDHDATNRPIQYFTTDKTAESLSLAYSTGTYPAHVINFAGIINASASGNAWTTLNQNITMTDGVGQIDLILATGPDDSNVGPKLSLKNEKGGGSSAGNTIAGTIQFESIADDASAAPTASMTSKILGVAAGNEYGDLRFNVANQNGSLLETLSLVGSAAAADSRVGIRLAAPESTLDVGGSIGAAFLLDTNTSKTLDVVNSVVTFSNASAVAVTMPAVSTATNRLYYLKNNGGGTVTCTKAGSDTFTMAAGMTSNTFALGQGEWATIIGGSGTWHVIQKGTVL